MSGRQTVSCDDLGKVIRKAAKVYVTADDRILKVDYIYVINSRGHACMKSSLAHAEEGQHDVFVLHAILYRRQQAACQRIDLGFVNCVGRARCAFGLQDESQVEQHRPFHRQRTGVICEMEGSLPQTAYKALLHIHTRHCWWLQQVTAEPESALTNEQRCQALTMLSVSQVLGLHVPVPVKRRHDLQVRMHAPKCMLRCAAAESMSTGSEALNHLHD